MSHHTHAEAIDGRASGGISVMVKKTIPHRQINLSMHKLLHNVQCTYHQVILLTTENWIICWNSCRLHLFYWATRMPVLNTNWGNPDTNTKGHQLIFELYVL